jgi:GTPase SAR1 family protein
MSRQTRVAIVATVLLGAALGVTTNVATGALPGDWRRHLWLAWPASLLLVVALVTVEVRSQTLSSRFRGSPTSRRRARERLLERVYRAWVSQVLEQSLYQEARLELSMVRTVDAPHPWGIVTADSGSGPEPIPPIMPLSDVFGQLDQAMLVLGPAGSGKTTIILELLRDLALEARTDDRVATPVYLHLASWATRRESLRQWVLREISDRYQIPPAYVQAWLDTEQLTLLLDGLDEVAIEYRPQCVEAINAFRRRHGTVPLVICCRTVDYEAIHARLSVYGTLTIQSLDRVQVEDFLIRHPGRFPGVLAALAREPELWELTDTPLTLSIMILAFRQPNDAGIIGGSSREERLDRLFAIYVRSMLAHRTVSRQRAEAIIRNLVFLAGQLEAHGQTIYTPDLLFSLSLPLRYFNRLSMVIYFLWIVANASAMGALAFDFYGWRGAVAGIITGALCGLGTDDRVDSVTLALQETRERPVASDPVTISNSDAGRTEGVWSRITFRLWMHGYDISVAVAALSVGVLLGWGSSPILGLAFAVPIVITGFIMWNLMLYMDEILFKVQLHNLSREFPSPRLRAALRLGCFVAPVIGVGSGCVAGLAVSWPGSIVEGAKYGLVVAVCSTLFSWGFIGGFAFLEQTGVRLTLKWAGLFPLPSQPFFREATGELFLRHAGEGYIFVHGLLQDYFASLLCGSPSPQYSQFARGEPDRARIHQLLSEDS